MVYVEDDFIGQRLESFVVENDQHCQSVVINVSVLYKIV